MCQAYGGGEAIAGTSSVWLVYGHAIFATIPKVM